MTTTEEIQALTIRELLRARGPCITLVLAGDEMGDTAIELKNALARIREELRKPNLDKLGMDGEALLQPIAAAATEARFAKGAGSMVILRSSEVLEIYRVRGLKPLVRVGERFDARTLVAAEAARKRFAILALSQKRTRILRCTGDSCEEVPFPAGYPSSLADAMQTRQPDHVLDNRVTGGPSIGAGTVLFGTSTDREAKGEYLLHFFQDVDRAVKAVLKGSEEPLVPAGVEQELALYRRANTYAQLVEPGVAGAPDGMDGAELQKRARAALEQWEQMPGNALPADLDRRISLGLASIHIHTIVPAAFAGRVSEFFFEANAQFPGVYDAATQEIRQAEETAEEPVDLVELAAYQTIAQGGEARIVEEQAMPEGARVCALFRYAA
ncbi:MAG TPA: hypothetical protein VKV17_14300 [Bryobacteraceae bacterium]|nr:hypothetical protein [Bryobacteraceae bacterium]